MELVQDFLVYIIALGAVVFLYKKISGKKNNNSSCGSGHCNCG